MILYLAAAAALSVILFSKVAGITPTPTSPKVRRALFELLPDVDGPVYELGAGWGGLTSPLASRYKRVIGYELSPIPWLVAWARSVRHKNVSLRLRNFWKTDLSGAALVVCYLYPGAMQRLAGKLEELQPGALVCSHTFALPGWQAAWEGRVEDWQRTPLYLYELGDCTTWMWPTVDRTSMSRKALVLP